MKKSAVDLIRDKLQDELLQCNNPHEAEAWANTLKSFFIAIGIQSNLNKAHWDEFELKKKP